MIYAKEINDTKGDLVDIHYYCSDCGFLKWAGGNYEITGVHKVIMSFEDWPDYDVHCQECEVLIYKYDELESDEWLADNDDD